MKKSFTSVRRQQNHDATVQAILDTARAIMREEGIAALSMQELARRMGMRAPSLYNYFSGKMELYDALFRLGFTLFDEHNRRLMETSTGWQDELRLVIEGYMSFAMENPELYQLCFERPVPGFVPSPESLELSFGLLNRSYGRVEQLKNEVETDLSSEQIVNLVIAIAHGITAMHLANEPHLPIGQGRFGSLLPIVLSILEKVIPVQESE
ncbi:MAG TPA: TetR/AcrR family transcriptional regulator [Chloroflexota bacterium]|nr:TetR/AcrR family transcriptional regulator [Chloroflexota bacterium]HUM68683.1 TetR/AcrR family transcriptional regulator [Chloroflexota bacterium]